MPYGTPDAAHESEWLTRKRRIDPLLDAAGWARRKGKVNKALRTEEEETAHGPADYALWLDDRIVGIVEAKKLTIGPQNVLTQAERYARGLNQSPYDFDGIRCPFLYATNGEVIWFHDVRHELNRSRQIKAFHTEGAIRELLERDTDAATEKLRAMPHDHPRLRPYQLDANKAVEQAIAERKRHLLVAMATGTGKTFTIVNQIYRLMKAGVAKRVLFLVDRRALAAQAVRAFNSFDVEPNLKFTKAYELYSSKFQKEDFGEEDRFDPNVLPQGYLTDPQPGHAFVYVATIQRMAVNILGRQVIFGSGSEEAIEDDADRLDIPIHSFDLIVADECHRGYTSQELSVWRETLDHFDAVKIGLTATPAKHTMAYFTHLAFTYGTDQAVGDGHLLDYDVVKVRSEVRVSGVFLREGDRVEQVDPETGRKRLDTLEDERDFDTLRWLDARNGSISSKLRDQSGPRSKCQGRGRTVTLRCRTEPQQNEHAADTTVRPRLHLDRGGQRMSIVELQPDGEMGAAAKKALAQLRSGRAQSTRTASSLAHLAPGPASAAASRRR